MANAKLIHQVTGSVTNPEQFPFIISACKECSYYAYIFHDKDVGADIHLHFFCEGRRSLKNWSLLLGIPENMIKIVHHSRNMNRYLIHLDHPEKAQYSISDVVTNNEFRYRSYLVDNTNTTPKDLFTDMRNLKTGRITADDFIEKYQFELNKLSFYSKFKIFRDLTDEF